jgi:hypothetical protein
MQCSLLVTTIELSVKSNTINSKGRHVRIHPPLQLQQEQRQQQQQLQHRSPEAEYAFASPIADQSNVTYFESAAGAQLQLPTCVVLIQKEIVAYAAGQCYVPASKRCVVGRQYVS